MGELKLKYREVKCLIFEFGMISFNWFLELFGKFSLINFSNCLILIRSKVSKLIEFNLSLISIPTRSNPMKRKNLKIGDIVGID